MYPEFKVCINKGSFLIGYELFYRKGNMRERFYSSGSVRVCGTLALSRELLIASKITKEVYLASEE